MPTASSPAPFFADHALSRRLEAVEVAQLQVAAGLIAERLPELGASALSLAGGVAAFCGVDAPISRAAGMGMSGPVTAEEMDALEDFYRSRQTPAIVLLSPFADESFFTLLAARGFGLEELDSVLIRLVEDDARPLPGGSITVDVARPEDARAWVRRSIECFVGSSSAIPGGKLEIYESAFSDPAATYLFARCDGAVAGTGAMYVHDRTAYLFATSTEESFRRRGIQAALIEARLSLAQAAGCTLAFSRTAPGGASQRNLERLGFRAVYSKAAMRRRSA